MLTIIFSLFSSARRAFQTRAALQAEILALRHQLLVFQRSSRGHRLRLSRADRFLWVWLSRLWSGWRSALLIVKPENRHRLASKGIPTVLEVEELPSGRTTLRVG
jgi:putative transposase